MICHRVRITKLQMPGIGVVLDLSIPDPYCISYLVADLSDFGMSYLSNTICN